MSLSQDCAIILADGKRKRTKASMPKAMCAVILVCAMAVLVGCEEDAIPTQNSTTTTTTVQSTTTANNDETTTIGETTTENITTTTQMTIAATTQKAITTTTQKATSTTTTQKNTSTSKQLQVIVGDSAWEQVMVYSTIDLSSSYSGINDWFVDNDKIHMITYRYNRYLIMDMNTGKLVTKVVLPDIPGAMRHVGDETWISFDTLKTIKVYDLKTGEFKRDIVLQQSVKNFQVYGDYLFYADTERAPWLYRYNLKTGKIDSVYVPVGGTNRLLELNTKDKLIYFAGTGTTGCYLYALDMETLEVKAQYATKVATSGGVFYSDGAVYWAGKKLNPTTLALVFEYERISTSSSWRSTIYAANGFVITDGGLYRSNTAVRLCKFPHSSACIMDDGTIVGYSSFFDSNDNSFKQFSIGENIFA